VRHSDFGRRFGHPDHSQLPADDLELCAQADRFAFAMPMRHDGDRLVIEPRPMGADPGRRSSGSAEPGATRPL
jgi:hypothetical protein